MVKRYSNGDSDWYNRNNASEFAARVRKVEGKWELGLYNRKGEWAAYVYARRQTAENKAAALANHPEMIVGK